MNDIIQITGKVKYPITIDPSVWIFDDRKADLESFFNSRTEKTNDDEDYTKSISRHWDREIKEGNEAPAPQTEKKVFKKQELAAGTFGIRFAPFLENAEIGQDAASVHIVSEDEISVISLEQAMEMIAAFSIDGKPLKEDGPMHLYFGDGSNRSFPIKKVKEIVIL
ncbi:peptidyl-prolyl cis-trans isomerase [Bacillus sp. FJAT-42376]|uniref:peptidyl-prolyl cis-trans isomerase n=1 Tax=Bacillus sp. FJAT-42376 TaxID=2014076 RepID=UPI000F4F21F1|nr:peptidyl-prolyl cis-trans isomerase [Bacillus sp. FJAT-42376]AZB42796.1 peptidyl-prolyl cis-trans isomerase [Bacillus sp. FJAT-42376]